MVGLSTDFKLLAACVTCIRQITSRWYIPCLPKNVPTVLAITLTEYERILILFGRHVTVSIKYAIKRCFIMPPQITCASALPGKMGKHENCIFHSNAVLVLSLNSNSCLIFFTARAIASAVLATAIPSVCLSVRHTPVLCQNDGT